MDNWLSLPQTRGFLGLPLGLEGGGGKKAVVSPCRFCPDSVFRSRFVNIPQVGG